MEMLHNPVSHQFARALCREEENYLEILPDFLIVKYELVKVGNYVKIMNI